MSDPEIAERQTEQTSNRVDSAKRRQITEGASRCFLALGFDAASMGAIAREAGVSKGTLYVYFKSKEELFETIVEEQRLRQADQIFKFDEAADVADELNRLGRELVRFLCLPNAISPLRTIIAIADRMPEVGASFYRAGPARGIASLRGYLERRVAAGALKNHDCEVSAAQFIEACVSLCFKPMLFAADGPPTEQRIEHVVGMAVNMFMAAYRVAK